MRKANLADIHEEKSGSPSGKFCTFDKPLNEAIGGDPRSNDLRKRWPFAVELTRIPPGARNYPFHSHSAQYEFYIIVSGLATVRDRNGETEAKPGDFFMFAPGEPHQLINNTKLDVTYYSIADNPVNDHGYYPDSDKWIVRIPESRQIIKGERVDYYHG
ncbi:MAG TPA: cupin domain-containing protein, partial [Paraburkholderia sp.]